MKIVEIFLFVQINVLMPSFGYCMLRFISCAFFAAMLQQQGMFMCNARELERHEQGGEFFLLPR